MGRISKRDVVEKYHCKEGQNLKDLLISLHHGKKMSMSEMAEALSIPEDKEKGQEEVRIGKTTVFHWFDLFEIPTKDHTPSAVSNSIEKSVVGYKKKNKYKDDIMPTNFDPSIDGFRCQPQCPYFDICKYKESSENNLCPISHQKRKKVIAPIKTIIEDKYKDNETLLQHYTNLAELTASTWELLERKMAYIKSEDVTQILNRPDPVTGEFKEVKVANLLNGEIQKDQNMLIKLLELLKVTPKTQDEKTDEDIFSKMAERTIEATKERHELQKHIDEEKVQKENRIEIRTEKDFNNVMKELESRKKESEPTEDEINSANSIEDMIGEIDY